jgi:hypothetical protein
METVVHRIPRKGPGGLAPRIQLGIMRGHYDHVTRPEPDRRFHKARWLAAVAQNATDRGVVIIDPDE